MRALVRIGLGLLVTACGGESEALFESTGFDGGGAGAASVVSTTAGTPSTGGSSSSEAGSSASEGGAQVARGGGSGGQSPVAGTASSGAGGSSEAGKAGATSTEGGKAGESSGGAGGSGGTTAGASGAAGAAGKSSVPDVPAPCEACRDNTLFYCDVSAVWPNGACVRCSDDGLPANDIYRDCDGPGPEHYVSKNDHDPGYGCETYVGYMGSCPE